MCTAPDSCQFIGTRGRVSGAPRAAHVYVTVACNQRSLGWLLYIWLCPCPFFFFLISFPLCMCVSYELWCHRHRPHADFVSLFVYYRSAHPFSLPKLHDGQTNQRFIERENSGALFFSQLSVVQWETESIQTLFFSEFDVRCYFQKVLFCFCLV